MAKKISFNRENLDKVKIPAGKDRITVYDTKTPGLTFTVRATGSRSFYVYRWIEGRPERLLLGKYPAMTPEQARDAAAKVNGSIAQGENPQDMKRHRRAEMTLDELFTDYLEKYAKVYKRERSWEDDQKNFKRYLTGWNTRRLSTIRQEDIQTLHAKIGRENGPYAANRLIALLSKMFAFAKMDPNPAKGIRKFKEQARERFLDALELQKFFEALRTEQNELMRDYFWILLLTGARRSNVASMEWANVNLDAGVWTIPADVAKGNSPIAVPLVEKAVKILRDRAGNGSLYVFPGHGKTGHLMEPKMAWAALLERAKLDDLRIHDLRRTLGSWQASTGASLPIIGKMLGHKNQATTAIYARLNIDPVRQSVETATTAMLEFEKPKRKKIEVKVTKPKRKAKARKIMAQVG